MKKLIPVLMLLGIANFALGQQKYFPFEIDGKNGITDINGNEAIKPIYKYTTAIPAKNQIYLQDFSEKPDIIFNSSTGVKQLYESVYGGRVKIKNVSYTEINNKGKQYLLSEESAKTINLTEDYSDFKNIGQYIIAKFYPKSPPAKSAGVDKNGKPLPPRIEPARKENFAVLTNDETLKRVMKNDFKSYIVLYKKEEEKKDDVVKVVEVVLVNLDDINEPSNFDYILFTKGNTHNLYNSKMVLVKTFVLAKADEDMLVEASKKIVKQNLSTSSKKSYAYPVMNAAPSMPKSKNSAPEPEEKKPFKPFFYVKELPNGNTLFAFQETEEISKPIFEAKKGVVVYLDLDDHKIRIEMNGKEDSSFNFDPKTGVIYLPKVYLASLGITLN